MRLWIGIAALVAVVVVVVLPFLLRFESSGTLSPQQAARASLGEEPTFVTLEGVATYVERVAASGDSSDGGDSGDSGDSGEGGDTGDGDIADLGVVTDEPLIVVLHGFGASAATWREVLPALADHGEVVAYPGAVTPTVRWCCWGTPPVGRWRPSTRYAAPTTSTRWCWSRRPC